MAVGDPYSLGWPGSPRARDSGTDGENPMGLRAGATEQWAGAEGTEDDSHDNLREAWTAGAGWVDPPLGIL